MLLYGTRDDRQGLTEHLFCCTPYVLNYIDCIQWDYLHAEKLSASSLSHFFDFSVFYLFTFIWSDASRTTIPFKQRTNIHPSSSNLNWHPSPSQSISLCRFLAFQRRGAYFRCPDDLKEWITTNLFLTVNIRNFGLWFPFSLTGFLPANILIIENHPERRGKSNQGKCTGGSTNPYIHGHPVQTKAFSIQYFVFALLNGQMSNSYRGQLSF